MTEEQHKFQHDLSVLKAGISGSIEDLRRANEIIDQLSPQTPKMGEYYFPDQDKAIVNDLLPGGFTGDQAEAARQMQKKQMLDEIQQAIAQKELYLLTWYYLDMAKRYLNNAYDISPLSDTDDITIMMSDQRKVLQTFVDYFDQKAAL